MAWSDTETCWSLESYDSGVARLLFPAGNEAAVATWSIEDTVDVMRGLSKTGALSVASTINAKPKTQKHTEHATIERVGDSGQYAVRRTTHDVTFLGTEYSGDDSSSSSGSEA